MNAHMERKLRKAKCMEPIPEDEMVAAFSSVYHTGEGFQKLSSRKNSKPLNAMAHFQPHVSFYDKAVFFILTCLQLKSFRQDFTRNYSSYGTVETLFIQKENKSSFGTDCVKYVLCVVSFALNIYLLHTRGDRMDISFVNKWFLFLNLAQIYEMK